MSSLVDVQKEIESKSLTDFDLRVIINSGSGTLNPPEILDKLRQMNPQLSIKDFHIIEDHENPDEIMAQWFRETSNSGNEAVIAVGGDGTLSLAIKYAIQKSIPVAVLAMGTFNLFARHYGLNPDPDKQFEQLTKLSLQKVSMCFANEIPFTTSAAFGLYPEIIEERENYQSQFGFRSQATGYFAGLLTFLRNRPSMTFSVKAKDEKQAHESLVLMATHNKIHLENLGYDTSKTDLESEFALVNINPETLADKIRLIVKGPLGTISEDEKVNIEFKEQVELNSHTEYLDCAIDGEVMQLKTPVKIKMKKNVLKIFLPNGFI